MFFVEHFKHFLLGRKFLVRTDNSAVRYWMRLQSSSYDAQGQTARWMVRLAAFDFDIKHRPGKQHGNADGMSRTPFLRCAQCELRPKTVNTATQTRKKEQSRDRGAKCSQARAVKDESL